MSQVGRTFSKALSFLGAPLIGLVLVGLGVMLLANEHPFARDLLCSYGVCFRSEAAEWWNKLLYDFAAGGVITVIFYWVLVRWPEEKRRARLKRSFRAQYRAFKIACIENFLAVADGGFAANLPEELLPVEKFRAYFKERVGEGKTRWDEVANNMTDYYLAVTLSRMEILRQEIAFVMQSVDLSEDQSFDLLKRFSRAIVMQRNATNDHDAMKSFLGFFWNLFAGGDWVEGYRARDIVEEMIDAI